MMPLKNLPPCPGRDCQKPCGAGTCECPPCDCVTCRLRTDLARRGERRHGRLVPRPGKPTQLVLVRDEDVAA